MDPNEKAVATAQELCERLLRQLGDNLATFALYGSVVRGEMVAGKSDINVLIVLEHSSPEAHRVIAEELRNQPAISPFVLSRWELPRSRRVFALKFQSIKRHCRILHGEDPLADFSPSRELLRFLCEQSLRNLRLRIKHGYIRQAHSPREYRQTLLRHLPGLFVTLAEVLRCTGVEIPSDYASRPAVIQRALGCDAAVLNDLLALRGERRRLSAEDAFSIHARLFQLLSTSLDWVRQQWPEATEIE